MPKISIIMPVYNVSKYLQKCLDSIVEQSLKDIEIICVDDGSTDNSLDILKEYEKKDERFVIVSQENMGQGIARNKGLKISNGKYVLFIDPDDWINVNALEEVYNFAEEKSANIVRFDYKVYDEYSKKTREISFDEIIKENFDYVIEDKSAYNYKMFKSGCMSKLGLSVWEFLYNRQFILDNEIMFSPSRRGEDHLFSIGATLCADKIYYLKKYLYFYRVRPGSAINSVGEDNFKVFDNIKRLKIFLIKKSLYDELKQEFTSYAQQCLGWHYDQTPKDLIPEYEKLCKKFFNSEKEFKKWLKNTKIDRCFIENIFSIKNKRVEGNKFKILTILGFTFLIRSKVQV